jgi:hypothetical protein
VLQVVAEQGFQSCEVGLPILDEERARHDRIALAAR